MELKTTKKESGMTLQHRVNQIISNKDLGGEDWGSCQYETAADFFAVLEDQGFDGLGITVKFDRTFHTKEVLPIILNELKNDWADDEWGRLVDPEFPNEFESIEEVFDWCRNESWDLWSAAPFIADFCFQNLDFTNMEKPTGFGPIGNQMVQSENYLTGACCFLLKKHGYITDDSVFSGFDT